MITSVSGRAAIEKNLSIMKQVRQVFCGQARIFREIVAFLTSCFIGDNNPPRAVAEVTEDRLYPIKNIILQ